MMISFHPIEWYWNVYRADEMHLKGHGALKAAVHWLTVCKTYTLPEWLHWLSCAFLKLPQRRMLWNGRPWRQIFCPGKQRSLWAVMESKAVPLPCKSVFLLLVIFFSQFLFFLISQCWRIDSSTADDHPQRCVWFLNNILYFPKNLHGDTVIPSLQDSPYTFWTIAAAHREQGALCSSGISPTKERNAELDI